MCVLLYRNKYFLKFGWCTIREKLLITKLFWIETYFINFRSLNLFGDFSSSFPALSPLPSSSPSRCR